MAEIQNPVAGTATARAPADRQLIFLLVINAVVLLAATLGSGGVFIEPDYLQSMGGQMPELGLLALAVALAMMSGNGGIDLSVVATANLCAVLAGLLVPLAVSPATAPVLFTIGFVAVAVLVGLVCGLLNGVLVAWVGMTPILATLGTQLVFAGLAVGLTNGSAVRIGYIEPFSAIGNDLWLGLPIPLWVLLAAMAGVALLLSQSAYGLQLLMMGTNPKAARYAGFPVRRILLTTYALSGLLSAVAAVLMASRASSAKWDFGSSYLLIAILIAVMAGVRPEGGHGRVVCVLLSAVALQFLSSAFNLLDLSNFFRDCAWGALLVVSLAAMRFDPVVWLRGLRMRRGAEG